MTEATDQIRTGDSTQPCKAEPHASGPADEKSYLLLACQGQWQRVGLWPDLHTERPQIIEPTARAAMRLHTHLTETAASMLPVVSAHPQLAPGYYPAQVPS